MVRHAEIEQARRAAMVDGQAVALSALPDGQDRGYIATSWERCLADGRRPTHSVEFAPVTSAMALRAVEANRALFDAAHPVLDRLAQALADTGYFAILTNADGIVVDASGPIDALDPRASLITRIGVDLSERAIGTSAIGSALAEGAPVWLHQGEHFHVGMAHYSCAGAPIKGPHGLCVGMLDLTGIDQPERPELVHLVTQAVRSIENALVLARPRALLVRLNWPGRSLGDETDGLIALGHDGAVAGANGAARRMVAELGSPGDAPVPGSALFALPYERLVEAAHHGERSLVLPLLSGLRLQGLVLQGAHSNAAGIVPADTSPDGAVPLRHVEMALIRKAVQDAGGNVMQAARALGISRATVYRKLDLSRQA